MKQCPKCSSNLADFVEVCPYCGTPVPLAPAPQFAAPLPGKWTAVPQNSGKALASLICGAVFFFWPFSAIVAVILGHLALADIKTSAGRLTGRGMAIGGLVHRLHRGFARFSDDYRGGRNSESFASEDRS